MKLITASIFLFFSMIQSECLQSNNSSSEKKSKQQISNVSATNQSIVVGAQRYDQYLSLLQDQKAGMLVNQTSVVQNQHLVDTLISQGIQITKIFAPEHGFRGTADAGEKIKDGIDTKTGLPIISLYGENKKPSKTDLDGITVMLYDIQDVGARFYTYISSMHYMMEACAENNIPLIILDRPNPNGHYVDGPVLDAKFKSFVGMHLIPVVYGLTAGELAMMINGEGWLKNGIQCDVKVITCENYDHTTKYALPIKPSPNLPNDRAIELYPSLCFFEGTTWSIGRGTNMQFQVLGHPDYESEAKFGFTPVSSSGAKHPKLEGKYCKGYDLTTKNKFLVEQDNQLNIQWLVHAYRNSKDQDQFFLENNFIDKLAGTDQLRIQILEGKTEREIRATWLRDLHAYKSVRKKYLLYKDFE